jgi:hypothetical protein
MVVGFAGYLRYGTRNIGAWSVQCDCGNEKEMIAGQSLKNGHSTSCGCAQADAARANGTHRMSTTDTYRVWQGIWARCTNPRNKHFDRYGGRGIRVCERWQAFEAFFADMGARPAGLTLDRIDNDGDYEPSNCRWASYDVQARNRSSTIFVEISGESLPVVDAARKAGIPAPTVYNRIRSGWPRHRWLEPSRTKYRRKAGVVIPEPERAA